jgi:hypothetical protein
MQLVEGEPLDRILADGPLDVARSLEIARQIASALSETHAADVVHRDLKPSNIVWRRDRNGDDQITLVDFGIAVCKPGSADATRLTSDGLIGTPHYMSPEQAQGEQVDARADLYALGCILFELLTATTPFEGSGFEVLLAHMGRPIPSPSERNPAVPAIVDELLARLMAKRPDDRAPTADVVVAMIDEALAHLERSSSGAATTPRLPRAKRRTAATVKDRPVLLAPRPSQRVRWLAFGAAGALALAAAGFTALRLTHADDTSARVADPPGPAPRREVFRDDGQTRLRLWVPEVLTAGRRHWFRLELRNKLGAPLDADQVVVTVEDPSGRATGLIARPRYADPSQFVFPARFPVAGTYRVRVFPPETSSTFEVELTAK